MGRSHECRKVNQMTHGSTCVGMAYKTTQRSGQLSSPVSLDLGVDGAVSGSGKTRLRLP